MIKYVIEDGKKYLLKNILSWVVGLNALPIHTKFYFTEPFWIAIGEMLPEANINLKTDLFDGSFILSLEDYFFEVKFTLNDQADFKFFHVNDQHAMHEFLNNFSKEVCKKNNLLTPMNWEGAFQIIRSIAFGEYSPIEDIPIKEF